MLKMTVGFLFHNENVLLVQKNHPDWQDGLWNGIGGKVDPGETPMDCMHREFVEKTRIKDAFAWELFCIESGVDYMVYFYKATVSVTSPTVLSFTYVNDSGERLQWFNADGQLLDQVGDLNYLIPMARDWRSYVAKIETRDDIKTRAKW